MIKQKTIDSLIEKYNKEFLSINDRIYKNKKDFIAALNDEKICKFDAKLKEKLISDLEYFPNDKFFTVNILKHLAGLDMKQFLGRTFCKIGPSESASIVNEYSSGWFTYDELIKKYAKEGESEVDTRKNIVSLFPDLFLPKMWLYKLENEQHMITKSAYDILSEFV